MLATGYIELLFTTADTPLAQEFAAALAGYSGVHLAAFSVADAGAAHARLEDAGFPMRPLVRFQRPVETESGPGIAAFTVVRVARATFAEGRVQLLTHRTENTVWQKRWLSHPNGALALTDLVIVAADVAEAATRFERFTARFAETMPLGRSISLDREAHRDRDRGCVHGTGAGGGAAAPALYRCLRASDRLARCCRGAIGRRRTRPRRAGDALVVPFPSELGVGAWLFAEHVSALPWRTP
jgi:hypothetical protein